MKKILVAISALALMFAFVGCTPEDKNNGENGGGQNKSGESKAPEGAVDLGVVMTRADGSTYNLYWAECNLGATRPNRYGDYYAWGEIDTKNQFIWATYRWGIHYNELTKYCYSDKTNYWKGSGSPDNKNVLEPEDDVAHVKLGGNWRMPTDDEWSQLMTKCTCEWTAQDGVNGVKVTGSNGNSIFLPAAGCRMGTRTISAGTYAQYWSSSLGKGRPDYALAANSGANTYFKTFNMSGYGRYYGLSIRPVTE